MKGFLHHFTLIYLLVTTSEEKKDFWTAIAFMQKRFAKRFTFMFLSLDHWFIKTLNHANDDHVMACYGCSVVKAMRQAPNDLIGDATHGFQSSWLNHAHISISSLRHEAITLWSCFRKRFYCRYCVNWRHLRTSHIFFMSKTKFRKNESISDICLCVRKCDL